MDKEKLNDLVKDDSCGCGCGEHAVVKKDDCDCGCGEHEHEAHSCDCGDEHGDSCDCGCEDENNDAFIVELEDENGNTVSCEVVEEFEFEDSVFALVQNPENNSVYLFKEVVKGDEVELVNPEDKEFERATAYYESTLEEDEKVDNEDDKAEDKESDDKEK